MASVKQLFFVPPIVMFVVMLIAIVRPASIFGGIHYGWILGIFISATLIMLVIIVWFYLTRAAFPSGNRISFAVTVGLYIIALIFMTVCMVTLPGRKIYINSAAEFSVINNIPYADKLNYYLERDIDFENNVSTGFGALQHFQGTFDGGGHILSNISNRPAAFLLVKENVGVIKDLAIRDTRLNMLVSENHGTIENISIINSNIDIARNGYELMAVGGNTISYGVVAGINYNRISNVQVQNTYVRLNTGYEGNPYRCLGGIVGFNSGGIIEKCEYYTDNSNNFFDYSIDMSTRLGYIGHGTFGPLLGGLVGWAKGGAIKNCVIGAATINSLISSSAGPPLQATGGLVGRATDNVLIENCIVKAKCEASRQNSYSGYKYEGQLIAFLDSADIANVYVKKGNLNMIGNQEDLMQHDIVVFESDTIGLLQLNNTFIDWWNTNRGYPTPYKGIVNALYDSNSMIGVWLVLGALGAVVFGFGVFNYAVAVKKNKAHK